MRAEGGGGFFDLCLDFLDHRLDGAGDEGQADKDQRDQDAPLGIGDLCAEALGDLTEGTVGGIKRGQGDAGDGGGQGEGQIDRSVDQLFAGELVAHQHPGEGDAEHQVDQGGEDRQAERQEQGGPDARTVDHAPDAREPKFSALEQQGTDRQQYNQRQHGHGDAHAEREAGHGRADHEGLGHLAT